MKITKKEYKAKKHTLETRLAEVKFILEQAALTNGANLYNIETWNDYHDEQDDIENALDDLEGEYLMTELELTQKIGRIQEARMNDLKAELNRRYDYCSKITAQQINKELHYGLSAKQVLSVWHTRYNAEYAE